jgi:histidinol dehydrogenase
MTMLNRISPSQVTLEMKDPVDPTALVQSQQIISQIRSSVSGPVDAVKLLAIAHKFGDISTSVSSFIISPQQCKDAFDSLPQGERQALIQIHHRIQSFAQAQRKSVVDMEMDIPGGKAGHTVSPCRGTFK